MTIIDGVGDEVTQFCIVVLCGIIGLLAWWSTAQRPHRFRTAVILDRNVRHIYRLLPRPTIGRRQHQHMLIISGNAPENNSQAPTSESSSENTVQSVVEPVPAGDQQPRNPIENFDNNSQETLVEDIEMNTIVTAMDSEANVLRSRRLAFFENRSSNSDSSVVSNDGEISQDIDKVTNEETEDNTSKSVTDSAVTESSDVPQEKKLENDKEVDESKTPDCNNTDNIRIRLKFLNDDLKLVDGSLQELLGDFKRRHFKVELNARKLVRLIFNGQVLQREAATLESCGLFDNCVVHCLVHQPRTQQQFAQVQQQLNPTNIPIVHINNGHNDIQGGNQIPPTDNTVQEERDWDLSHILFTMLASLLSVAWYIHIRFSNLFGVPASLAMLGLTGIYIIAVICVYFSETQPTPNANAANNAPRAETAESNNAN